MKVINAEQAAAFIGDGCVLMSGGFMGCGSAHKVIDALVEKNVKDLHLISTDTATETYGIGKLIMNRQVKKLFASHIGTNKETGRQMSAGELDVTLIPQGTLAERIRAGGYGLGGILTPTGLGTMVAECKRVIEVDGVEYLLELPLRAEVAILYATYADRVGNCVFDGTTRNFNTLMAMAADRVIIEVEEIKNDIFGPNDIVIPSILVDYIVVSKEG